MIRIENVAWKTIKIATREGESLGVRGGRFVFASPWEEGFEPLIEAEFIHAALASRCPSVLDEFTVAIADDETLVYRDPSVHVIVLADEGVILGPLEDGIRSEISILDEDEDGDDDDDDNDE